MDYVLCARCCSLCSQPLCLYLFLALTLNYDTLHLQSYWAAGNQMERGAEPAHSVVRDS
jgi:hypothetical protein